MRCRKVRYFLSAYCKDELSERRTKAVREHLDNRPECRREEAAVREMQSTIGDLKGFTVSPDFNSRLLKRIAEERFKETRTKAFMPKRIPIFSLNRVAPIVAAACFVFAFIFAGGIDGILINEEPPATAINQPDNSYATVRENTNQTANVHRTKDWAFQQQLRDKFPAYAHPVPRIPVHQNGKCSPP